MKADELLYILESDELSLNNKENHSKFIDLKAEMRQLPVYDKGLFLKVLVYDWLFSTLDMLEETNEDGLLSIGSWDSKLKQAE